MIEVISGTNRPDCNALKVANLLLSMYREEGAQVQLINLQDLPPEIFQPISYANKPASFQPYQQRILDAAGLHIVTPEYNGSFPGVLKYFIDMLKFPESFQHRPVAFTGECAGVCGALRPIEQLEMIFGYRNAHILPERVFIAGVGGKFDAKGAFTDDTLRDRLRDQVKKFIVFTKRFAD
ncbi:MAG: NAD(P)H-dependent oxidoreductase [bacterium]